MNTNQRVNILHWPSSYLNPARGKPYDCIFVKEHIHSVAPYSQNRVLFTSADPPTGRKLFEIQRSMEDGVKTDRIYFKTIRPLWITNIYIRVILFLYFLRLIIVERFYPEILHVHFYQSGLLAIGLCKLFKIRMVVTEHWSAFLGWPELPELRFKKAAKVFEYAKWVFAVSERIKKGVEERTGAKIQHKYSVTLNAVDTTLFFSSPTRTIDNKPLKNILCVARLSEEKDLPTLFRALAVLASKREKFICDLIGKGDSGQYQSLLEELDIVDKVCFHGEKPKAEIAAAMRNADILVISSFIENSPCVIGEALCTGLPVVSTNVGGIPELIDDSNGILVPPSDPQKFAQALYEALFERNFDRETISKKAQAHFSYSAIGQQIFSAYQKVLGQTD